MDSVEMKRNKARKPAGPTGNHDQNKEKLARGREASQQATRPIKAALVNLRCNDGVRKSRYGRAAGAALTGGG